MGFSKFNKGTIDWEVDTKDWPYKKCSDLKVDTLYPFKGCFITADNGYGKGAVIISDGILVNVPQHFVDTARDIMADEEAVAQIKAGHAGFKLGTYENKQKKVCYRVTLVDVE